VAMGAALLLGVISACGAFTKAGDKLNKLGAAQTLGNPTELTLRADLERSGQLGQAPGSGYLRSCLGKAAKHCTPPPCELGHADLGSECEAITGRVMRCQRKCKEGGGSSDPSGSWYSDLHQSRVSCPDDFTAANVTLVGPDEALEWTQRGNSTVQVEIWGGGGGGTGSSLARDHVEEVGINVKVHAVSRTFDMFYKGIPFPSGIYYKFNDTRGKVRYATADDTVHLVHHESCEFLHDKPCWEFRVNSAIFRTDMQNPNNMARARGGGGGGGGRGGDTFLPPQAAGGVWYTEQAGAQWAQYEANRPREPSTLQSAADAQLRLVALDGSPDRVPQGRQKWIHPRRSDSSYPFTESQLLLDITIEPAHRFYAICGGSGGSGAHVLAVVLLQAGRRYRLEAGRGGSGAKLGGAGDGQSSRLLERGPDSRWRVLAEAGGGFGAGAVNHFLYSPGGAGGIAPRLASHRRILAGKPGQASRRDLFMHDQIPAPDFLTALPASFMEGFLPPGARCHKEALRFGHTTVYPELCTMPQIRRPSGESESYDYFVTCVSTGCSGIFWPLSPAPGEGATGHGLASGFGGGGNGSCPVPTPESNSSLQEVPGMDGHPGVIIAHSCKRQGAYALLLQRCDQAWTLRGLRPRGVRNCEGPPFQISAGLEQRLKSLWPSCDSQEPKELWAREWQKHGTCFGSDPEHYFDWALELLLAHAGMCSEWLSPECEICLTESLEPCDLGPTRQSP
ncbi:unnamed protein product, partial [Symbiodinium microadriaticum]